MAEENFLRKLLSTRSKTSSGESTEDKIRKIVAETLASCQENANAASSSKEAYDVIQHLTKVMNFHVQHAASEKSELAAEKAKRLLAEKEAEELKKKLEELKLVKGNDDKVEKIEMKLNQLESEVLLKNLVESLSSGNTNTDFLKNMTSERNTNEKNKKVYDDPDWFPGTSKSNEFLNSVPQNKVVNKDQCSTSAPMLNNQSQPYNLSGNSGNMGGYSGDLFPKQGLSGPFPRPICPFPGQQGPFPGQQGPFPGQQGQFPGQQGPFPGQQGPFPGQQGPFPGQPGPHPLMGLSYNNAQYPHVNQQFHGPSPFGSNGNSMPSQHQFPHPPQAVHNNRPRGPAGFQQRGCGRRTFKSNLNQGPDQVKFTKNGQKSKQQNCQKQQQNKQQPSEQAQKTSRRSRNRNKSNNRDSEDGATCKNDNQPPSSGNTNSVNLTSTELKNVKHALNTKKLNDDFAKQNTKTVFKKKKQSKGNQNEQGSPDCSDDDDDDDDCDNANIDCNKNSDTKESRDQTPRKQRNSQDVGGARKKDGSGIDSNKKKTNKNPNIAKQNPNPGASNSKSGFDLFIGDKFPTLKDIEDGKLSLTQGVKNIIMVAKIDDKPISEIPKTVQDMILFNMNYPDAKVVVTQ